MAIVSKGSGGSIKFTGTGGGISITSSGGGGGGGGGGGAPDASNLYSLLRRGVNQTSTVNELTETIITGWTDARGAGLGHPKFLPQGRWDTGGAERGCLVDVDGSVVIRGDGAGGKTTFMRSASDDSGNPLSNVTNGSWTAYVRYKNPLNPFGGPNPAPLTGKPVSFYAVAGGGYWGEDTGDSLWVAAQAAWHFETGGWSLLGRDIESNTYFMLADDVEPQYIPNPNEYQVMVLRGSPAQGWSFRLSNSSGGGSFGSNFAYSNAGYDLDIGRVIHIGDMNAYTSTYNVSDFAVYKSYHDESTATQVISHLVAAP